MNPRLILALVLAAPPAFSATLFVDASAPPGGDGSTPARAYSTLGDALAAARLQPAAGTLVIHLAAGTYPISTNATGDGLVLDIPRLRLEGETQFSFDARGVPQAVSGGATALRGISGFALVRVLADEVSLSGLVFDGVDGNLLQPQWRGKATVWTLIVDGGSHFSLRRCVSTNSFFGALVRSTNAVIEENIFGTDAPSGNHFGVEVAGGPEARNISVVFQRNLVENNSFFGAVFMGDNAAEASLADAPADSALYATIAGNELLGNFVAGLTLSMRENLNFSDYGHKAHLVTDAHDDVVAGNANFGAVVHAPQGVFRTAAACLDSPPARVDATFSNETFAGNGLDGAGDLPHCTFDAVASDVTPPIFSSCFVNGSTINVDIRPATICTSRLGGVGNTLLVNGVAP